MSFKTTNSGPWERAAGDKRLPEFAGTLLSNAAGLQGPSNLSLKESFSFITRWMTPQRINSLELIICMAATIAAWQPLYKADIINNLQKKI